ncbi:MAG: regulator [Pseudomonadota bacterium]
MLFGKKTAPQFDDSRIRWKTLDGIDHLAYHIYRVDQEREIVDAIFKFDASKKIFLHKHHAEYVTLVMDGELRIYKPNGELKEVRPTGSYVLTQPGADAHTEGGGDMDTIVFFSIRGTKGAFYDILDEALAPIETVGFEDFKALYQAQH